MDNLIDRVVGYFNPEAGLNRIKQRMAMDNLRQYNAATRGRRRGNLRQTNENASRQVSRAANRLSGVSQDLVRNNPLAQRIKMIYATNIVGAGITPVITGRNNRVADDFQNFFDNWASSTACDFDGQYSFNGLLFLACASMVETGGVFLRIHNTGDAVNPIQIQLIEQTYLDATRDRTNLEEGIIIDGVEYSAAGQIEGYHIDIDPSGTDTNSIANRRFYRKDTEIIHLYRKERPGQHIGVSWLAQIATHLDRYDTLQDAKVMQQQIAACLAVLIENAPANMGTGDDTDANNLTDRIEPGTIQYVPAGSQATVITPPRADDSQAFITELKNDMSVGAGLNYQQLTGDFSRFNFASGRMGKIEFNVMLDTIQQQLMLPVLNKVIRLLFDSYQLIRNTNTTIDVDWVFSPRASVDEMDAVDTAIKKTRNGIITPQTMCRMFGTRLESVVEGWNEAYELYGDASLDIRPDLFSAAGNQIQDSDDQDNSGNNDNTDVE